MLEEVLSGLRKAETNTKHNYEMLKQQTDLRRGGRPPVGEVHGHGLAGRSGPWRCEGIMHVDTLLDIADYKQSRYDDLGSEMKSTSIKVDQEKDLEIQYWPNPVDEYAARSRWKSTARSCRSCRPASVSSRRCRSRPQRALRTRSRSLRSLRLNPSHSRSSSRRRSATRR